MAHGSQYVSFSVNDRDKIIDFIGKISSEMSKYIKDHSESQFFMFYKFITHSDLICSGKATKKNSHKDNLLYYIGTEDMLEIEEKTEKNFQTAHQSNIGLSLEVYETLGIPNPRDVLTNDNKRQYLLNDYYNVFIEKNNMEYFNSSYTTRVFKKLGKEFKKDNWSPSTSDLEFEDAFKEIDLHVAVHGIGMSIDKDFFKVRHNLFKGDSLILLCEKNNSEKGNIFFLFDKNPIFYNVIGETNKSYTKYQQKLQQQSIIALTNNNKVIDEETEISRAQQNAWREMLAKEMMGYTQLERQVMCPFTYIQADFDALGTIYRASHIKGFSDPNTKEEEKYDINNGLLLVSNADALFDKHLITVGENKELIFSFLLDTNIILKQQLMLMNPIFKAVLNDKRMEYLEYHRKVFDEKEMERKTK